LADERIWREEDGLTFTFRHIDFPRVVEFILRIQHNLAHIRRQVIPQNSHMQVRRR
jgi:hypothetical protein